MIPSSMALTPSPFGNAIRAAWAGVVVKEFDLVTVFWVIPILGLVNTLFLLLIPESLTWNTNKTKTLPNSQSIDTLVTVADENPAMKQDARIASRVEAFARSFVPEQLPNTLGVKHGATKIMIVGFLALTAIIGNFFCAGRTHPLSCTCSTTGRDDSLTNRALMVS